MQLCHKRYSSFHYCNIDVNCFQSVSREREEFLGLVDKEVSYGLQGYLCSTFRVTFNEPFVFVINWLHCISQIRLYNSMLEKEGTAGEEEAKKAYKKARKESDHALEDAAEDKISTALIDKVNLHCYNYPGPSLFYKF